MTIMTNTAINTHRSRQRRPTKVLTADLPESPTMRHGASSHWRSPEKCLLESMPADRTLTALRQLPNAGQVVLSYAEVGGLRYSEIADILGVPAGSVMSRIHRARQRLRHRLSAAGLPTSADVSRDAAGVSNCHVDSPTVRHESGGMADQRLIWGDRSLVDRIGGAAYDYAVEREWLARPSGLAMWGTDIHVLYDSIRLIGDMPDFSAVLDVPCGGGLALRGLRSDQRVRYVAADISTDMLAPAVGPPTSAATTSSSPRPTSSGCRSTTRSSTCACPSAACTVFPIRPPPCLRSPAASSRAAGWSAIRLCAALGCVRIWRSARSAA